MTSIIIDYTDSNAKKGSKSLSYVNPQATDAQLAQMAIYFNAISTNTYVGASRVDKRELVVSNDG